MAATVTLDQAYFETLLRRAEFHTSGRDLSTPIDVPLVTIPKVDHDNLLQLVQEYYRLREALYKGGIEQETLETLIRGEHSSSSSLNEMPNGTFNDNEAPKHAASRFYRPQGTKVLVSRPSNERFKAGEPFRSKWPPYSSAEGTGFSREVGYGHTGRHNSSASDENAFSSTVDYEKDENPMSTLGSGRRHYERSEQRTIIAKNLHDRTTYKDLTDIIRGGLLLDIHLKSNERTAFMSFVEGQNAASFMNYVKRNDMFIHGKRIEWSWSDRQFFLPGHVAGKIGIGATRNIVIRSCSPKITEEKIRDDLDHIHNLVVISVTYLRDDCFITLNSIHNSLFARTCLMSRTAYKGMKIEWCEDECSWPLPQSSRPVRPSASPPKKKPTAPMNRFQMLGLDGDDSEDGEDENESDDATATTEMTKLSISGRTPWDASSIVAA